MRFLLGNSNINVNPRENNQNQTPLHICSFNGSEICVRILLEHSDIDGLVEDLDGKTPLQLAMDQGHQSIVNILE